uniref:Putative ovule protein n=1 Tax=Solanum chacoense TaxID=4108 RepID=A0A0V0GWS5_SOLCH
MSQTKTFLAIFVLAMIFSNIMVSIEGRNIKFEDKNYLMKPNVHTIMKSKRESRKLTEFTVQNNENPPASPSPGHVDGHSPGIGH